MSHSDHDQQGSVKPSALLQSLAAIAARHAGAHKRYKDARYGGSSGAANAGKRLVSWSCGCGWTGAAKELQVHAGRLTCPSCGATESLKSD